MNLAVNNFGKGLQTDTHPMIQGTDTLSDCLNGTLITMNGNEVILQNDMGNRRVNNAFLPPGYLPVGMKEYGGVIYIAAYNPITNKSQIGSFPSPQREINNEINKDLLGNKFDFELTLSKENTYKYLLLHIPKEVIFLDNDVFLVPLTSDIVIHAGDKFVVSASGLERLLDLISNYRNTNSENNNTTKAISPKNRRYTLSLGILNSQNEFVDITKTLCRWEKDGNWKIKNYGQEYSDIFKFNDEYFIPDSFDNSSLDETIEDSRFIKTRLLNRQILLANTYSYKLIGPLYLKVALNHIETFSFNIYGTNNSDDESNNISLQIEALITYNCPDGVTRPVLNGNLDYETFDEGMPDFRVFDLIDSSEIRNPESIVMRNSTYNPNSNLYSVKITKKYNIESENDLYNYFIGVLADKELSENSYGINPIYLKGLSVEGTIDLNLLGSGQVIGDIWKFYNTVYNDERIDIKLSVGLSAYTSQESVYRNLRFKLVNINKDENEGHVYYGPINPGTVIQESEGPLPNFTSTYDSNIGINSIIQLSLNESNFISTENEKLPTGAVFKVYTYVDVYENDEFKNTMELFEGEERWFISTELFNEFFNNSKISNFCTVETDPEEAEYNESFANKMVIKLDSSSELIEDSRNSKSEIEGSLVSNEEKILYKYKNSISFKYNYSPTVSINNKENLPNCIEVNGTPELELEKIRVRFPSINAYNDTDGTSSNGETILENYKSEIKNTYKDRIIYITTTNVTNNDFKEDFNDMFSIENITSNDSEIIGTIVYKDILSGKGSIVTKYLKFENFFTYLEGHFKELVGHFGVVLNYQQDKNHLVDIVCKISSDSSYSLDRVDLAGPDNYPPAGNFWINGDKESIHGTYINGDDLSLITRISTSKNPFELNYQDTYDMSGVPFSVKKGIETYGNDITNDTKEYYGSKKIFGYLFSPTRSIGDENFHSNKDKDYISSLLDLKDDQKLGSQYTRVWWRKFRLGTSNDEWVLINDLFEKPQEYNNSAEKFIEFLKGTMKDYIYCTDESYTSSENIYSIQNGEYKYTNLYNINIYLSFIFNVIKDSDTEIIDNIPDAWGNLTFKIDSNSTIIKEVVSPFNIRSNNNFYKSIENIKDTNLISIYKNGDKLLFSDNNGNLLDINTVYYLDENLILDNNVKRIMLGGNPVILCSNYANNKSLQYRYDHLKPENSKIETHLDYEGVEIPNFNNE